MATRAKINLDYEQLLAIISACQLVPERKCIRLALDCEELTGNPVFDCLNRFSGVVDRQALQNSLSGNVVQVLFSKLPMHYELLQRIDGDSVVTEVNRLVETIGVNLVMIGFSNGYVTALALVLRTRFPQEWNKFCDFSERQQWKIDIEQAGTRSFRQAASGFHREQVQNQAVATNEANEQSACDSVAGRVSEAEGFTQPAEPVLKERRKSELEEEDDDELINGLVTGTANNTGGRAHQWSFRKFGLRR